MLGDWTKRSALSSETSHFPTSNYEDWNHLLVIQARKADRKVSFHQNHALKWSQSTETTDSSLNLTNKKHQPARPPPPFPSFPIRSPPRLTKMSRMAENQTSSTGRDRKRRRPMKVSRSCRGNWFLGWDQPKKGKTPEISWKLNGWLVIGIFSGIMVISEIIRLVVHPTWYLG